MAFYLLCLEVVEIRAAAVSQESVVVQQISEVIRYEPCTVLRKQPS